jgi:hypothetical protein
VAEVGAAELTLKPQLLETMLSFLSRAGKRYAQPFTRSARLSTLHFAVKAAFPKADRIFCRDRRLEVPCLTTTNIVRARTSFRQHHPRLRAESQTEYRSTANRFCF